MLRTPVCLLSYPIVVSHLSFNILCQLLLYSIYLDGNKGFVFLVPGQGVLVLQYFFYFSMNIWGLFENICEHWGCF
jgi:hypothetical protein